jgi:hypothetical protein
MHCLPFQSMGSRGGWTAYPARAWVYVEDELLILPEHGFTWRMNCLPFQSMGSRGGWTAYPSRASVHVEDELLTLPEHQFTWRMNCLPLQSISSRGGWTAYPSRAWVHVEDELLTLPEHGFTWRMTCVPFQNMGSLPVLCGFLVDQSLAFCSVFVDNYVSFYPFTFSHCIVCPSSFYGFWLLLWYLQTLLIWSYLCIIWHVYWLLK